MKDTREGKMAKKSPTQRTLEELRSRGYLCAVVEKWNQFAKIRQDLYGFIDILCLHPEEDQPLAIQCTTRGNVSARVKKIKEHENFELVKAKMVIEVWGWGKLVSGWQCKVVELS
jgi:hypothetical protein